MICHTCLHLIEGTEHFSDGRVSAENTSILHHQAHVTCTTVTLSHPVPTIGPRSTNPKMLSSVHSEHLYFRVDFRTNRDYSLLIIPISQLIALNFIIHTLKQYKML